METEGVVLIARKHRRYDGVTAFVGMPGSGKTYSLVQVAERSLAKGKRVFTNLGFDVRGTEQYGSFEEMMLVPPGSVILLDEAPTVFSARRWQDFPDALLYRLTQVRKDGLEFYYSAIHEEMVDVTLRRLTFWFWHCQAITGRLLRRRRFPPEVFRRQDARPDRREFFYVRNETAALYDTLGKVAIQQRYLDRIRDLSGDRWVRLSTEQMAVLLTEAQAGLRMAALDDASTPALEPEAPAGGVRRRSRRGSRPDPRTLRADSRSTWPNERSDSDQRLDDMLDTIYGVQSPGAGRGGPSA